MDDLNALLNLPIETLAVLGLGYMAYRVAYIGQDGAHRAVDITFLSLAFGLFAKLTMLLVQAWVPLSVSVLVAMLVTLALAAFWRAIGISLWQKILRFFNISYSDGKVSAWDTMRVATKLWPTQLVVRTSDGPDLMCDHLSKFSDAPHGPCLYGQDGSVSLYVTHIRSEETNGWLEANWTETELGQQLTYVPRSNVTFIEIRHLTT